MTPEVKYVPTVVRWEENGTIQQRTVNIEEGMNFDFRQSGKKYAAQSYDASKGKVPVLTLKKEDAYNMLGLSHANEDGYKNRQGEYIYVLDSNDIEAAKHQDISSKVGTGGRFVQSGTIYSPQTAKHNGLNIIHKSNSGSEYEISVFMNKQK